ncbi:MAG: S9 family peptidase [Bacteroidota bacterium]
MKSKFLQLFVLFFISNLSFAQTKRTITHEDLIAMKRVGVPVLSPDGKQVIFSVLETSYNEKDNQNDLWIVPTDGSEKPRKLTAMKAGESDYSWSPDGKYISFVAKRDTDEEAQIYLLNMQGGEAQRFTNLNSGASTPKWSPDGKQILFQSQVYIGAFSDSTFKKIADVKKNQKYKARVYETYPIRNFDKWIDEKQTHLFVQNIDSKQATDLFQKIDMCKSVAFKLGGSTWADNSEIVFAASVDSNSTGKYLETQLFKISKSGGVESQITKGPAIYSNPKISEDGKFLFCESYLPAYKMYFLEKITRFDWPNLTNKIELNAKIDRPVVNYKINQNGGILATIEDKGNNKIYTLNQIDNIPITTSTKGNYSNISEEMGVKIASYESVVQPPEIVRINADGSHLFLTNFNENLLKSLDMNDVQIIWTKAKNGKNIRSMITKPAHFDPAKKYPLVVLMHGGPSMAYTESFGYRWQPNLIAGDDFVVIMTDYTGSTGYGEKFAQDIQFDPFKGPAEEIQEAASDAIKRFSYIDGSRQAASGASYGGHLANWLQATTSHYKCLISHAGLVNSVSQWGTSDGVFNREVMNGGVPWENSKTWKEQNPYNFANNFKTPILLTVGENDFRVPINNTIENYHILQRKKIPSRLVVFPEENHWILKPENSRFHYKEVKDWLKKWLIVAKYKID